jgi:hypothetical protein
VLSGPVAAQLLKPAALWHPEVIQRLRRIKDQQLPVRDSLQIGPEATYVLPSPDPRSVSVPERLDHDTSSITRRVNNV